jgi:hypothetical protein
VLVAGIPKKWQNFLLKVILTKEHTNVFAKDEIGSQIVAPNGVIREFLAIRSVIDHDGFQGCLTNGTFAIVVQVTQSQMTSSADFIMLTRSHGLVLQVGVANQAVANHISLGEGLKEQGLPIDSDEVKVGEIKPQTCLSQLRAEWLCK